MKTEGESPWEAITKNQRLGIGIIMFLGFYGLKTSKSWSMPMFFVGFSEKISVRPKFETLKSTTQPLRGRSNSQTDPRIKLVGHISEYIPPKIP